MTPIITCPQCGHNVQLHGEKDKCSFSGCSCKIKKSDIRRFYLADELAAVLEVANASNYKKEHWALSSKFQRKIDNLLRLAGRMGGRVRIYWTKDRLQPLADYMMGQDNAKTQVEICNFRFTELQTFPRIRKQLERFWVVKAQRLTGYKNAPSVYWIEGELPE